MTDALKLKLATLPLEPGCYLMKNNRGKIIYVGKAKQLKKRVNQYFHGAHDYKTSKMVSQIADFDFILTKTEKEALILEINLIKEHRPRFNIMFMDDKSYPYLKLTREAYPQLTVARDRKRSADAEYFGPYPDATAAATMARLLNELYPLRKCNSRPGEVCLYHHLGQCLCRMPGSEAEYAKIRRQVAGILRGNTGTLKAELRARMQQASDQMHFEVAAQIRDQLKALVYFEEKQQVQMNPSVTMDLFNYAVHRGYIGIVGLFVRQGRLLERTMVIEPAEGDAPEDFMAYLIQFYQKQPVPAEVIVPQGMDTDLLSDVLNTHVTTRMRGHKKQLLELAAHQAIQRIDQRYERMMLDATRQDEARQLLGRLLNLPKPERIEVYDNAHLSGADAIGGCIVFDEGRLCKEQYRIYKVHAANNDLENMKEVVYRRYFRILRDQGVRADLILVDGGLLQQQAVQTVLTSLGMDIPVAALVKNERHQTADLLNMQGLVVDLHEHEALFQWLSMLQDEVHRYTIGAHRRQHQKRQTRSLLEEVPGISKRRRQLLLNHFHSMKQIRQADVTALSRVIPHNVAQSLYDYLRQEEREHE